MLDAADVDKGAHQLCHELTMHHKCQESSVHSNNADAMHVEKLLLHRLIWHCSC
jgi:hypothetical protein